MTATAISYPANSGRRNLRNIHYGNIRPCLKTTGTDAETNSIRYSSEYCDHELGMIYYNYRHYNPQDGRWLSRDPMGEQGGTNLYGFCSNNPVSQVDNLGMYSYTNTGFSAHWGNIVREKKPWAIVCYKYYKNGDYMGSMSEYVIWNELAKANKLNYEERDKWVKGYKPIPESGDLFGVPNTFSIYIADFEKIKYKGSNPIYRYYDNGLNERIPGLTMCLLRDKMNIVKDRFVQSGVHIEEKNNVWDNPAFLKLWKSDGIFGIGFVGHGDVDAFLSDGKYGLGTSFKQVKDSGVPYKLSLIIAYNCQSAKVGWQYFLSRFGEFYGFDYDFNSYFYYFSMLEPFY